ncbi:AraC family transcriptional regulator [Mucilaginibacter roseus]|uniref:AraC family transcriptional regulator n=1 Tax=Mucilaginibacter roseus TaxID=1528868 RepID=A0ABS8U1F9_9SPHI|nr:AraC family transcriptional regulator [Mucilaginibacter roseus]MCD8739358.1 AraC family transcriptional regulator [Mucilaginibacter roseus]
MEKSPKSLAKGQYVGNKTKELVSGGIIVSETVFEAGMCSEWHFHQNPHFSHILSGGSIEERPRSADHQLPGKGLYYYPGIPHRNVAYKPGTRIINIELEQSFFEHHQLESPKERLMFDPYEMLNTGGLIKILNEFKLDDASTPLAIEQACVELISHKQETRHPGKDWMNRINSILNDQWNDPITLVDLAAQMGIHPVTLSRLFTVAFHCTFGEYLRKLKIERSFTLIRNKKYSLTEVAYMCGFYDQAHFTRTFLNTTGTLPKTYRGF